MTKAFDSALFIPPNPNAGELVEIASPGPPLKTQFGNYIAGPPGTTVEASVPAATAQGQSLLSGPGPDFDWSATATTASLPTPTAAGQTYVSGPTDPFTMQLTPAAPQPTAANQVMVSNIGPPSAWATMTTAQLSSLMGALTIIGGNIVRGGQLTFGVNNSLFAVIDGGDPTKNAIDNFTIDAGTF